MANKQFTMKRNMRYGTRMMTAGEPVNLNGPQSRLFQALGWAEERKRAKRPQLDHDDDGKEGGSKKPEGDDLAALRAEYMNIVGKRPFHGWGVDELRNKIAAAGEES